MNIRLKRAVIGVDPSTQRCEIVATNTDENLAEIRKAGLIAVPCEAPTARRLLGELVPDVFAVANEVPA